MKQNSSFMFYNTLKASYTHFLESNGFTKFYGVDSAI